MIVNEGRWIERNGQRRSNVGGLKSWQEWNKSEPSNLRCVDRTTIRQRRCLEDNDWERFYLSGNSFYRVVRGKGRSPPDSIHRVPCSSGGERGNHLYQVGILIACCSSDIHDSR